MWNLSTIQKSILHCIFEHYRAFETKALSHPELCTKIKYALQWKENQPQRSWRTITQRRTTTVIVSPVSTDPANGSEKHTVSIQTLKNKHFAFSSSVVRNRILVTQILKLQQVSQNGLEFPSSDTYKSLNVTSRKLKYRTNKKFAWEHEHRTWILKCELTCDADLLTLEQQTTVALWTRE